jgi:hypothetical protein
MLGVLAMCAVTANAQTPASQKTTSTTRAKTTATTEKTKTSTKTYSGCLKGDATAGYTLGTSGANATTYTVTAAPDSTNVDFTSGVNKRVEIVSSIDPHGNMQTTQTSGAASSGHAAGTAHQLSVQSIRVLPGSCEPGTTTTRSKTSTKTTTNP